MASEPESPGTGVGPTTPANGLPLRAAMPGIALVIAYAFLATALAGKLAPWVSNAYSAGLMVLPWAAILTYRKGSVCLGFTRRRFLAHLGWGGLLGLLWRGTSLLVNYALIRIVALQAYPWTGFETTLISPWMEEVFFRGYLGTALSGRFGRVRANLLQAVLFTLQPAHTAQGFAAGIQIFIFGLAAGWLVQRTGSIWAAIAAHGAANFVVFLLSNGI